MNAAHRLSRAARRAAPLALAALLAACAGRQPQTAGFSAGRSAAGQGYYRVGAPYEVSGVWYYPKVDYHYDRTGIASWYGPGYNGRLTSNGEIFNMNTLSAAHPTLPLPSIVRVTDLQNGRSLDLRVNDRGPFAAGRIIDLSRRAAQLLGFEIQGTAPVRVQILKRRSIEVAELARRGIIAGGVAVAQTAPAAAPASPVRIARAAPPPRPAPVAIAAAGPPRPYEPPAYRPPAYESPAVASARIAAPRSIGRPVHLVTYKPPAPPRFRPAAYRLPALHPVRLVAYRAPEGRIYVQAGAFSVPRNAWRVRARVARLASVRVSEAAVRGVALYRVRLGPFASAAEAHRVLARVVRSGYPDARLVFN